MSNVGHGLDGGFLGWIKEAAPQIPRSTAYNYINAALNSGLTIESTADDVTKLKSAKTLDDITVKSLYAPPSATAQEEADKILLEDQAQTPGKYSLISSCLISVREETQQLLDFKDDMTPEVFETSCARLLSTLESMTGSKWAPAPNNTETVHFTEHPESYSLGS